jgi:RHS repeat-associated protein
LQIIRRRHIRERASADEQFNASGGDLDHFYWTLGDHQGTVRDVAELTPAGESTPASMNLVNHRQFDSFGVQTDQTNSTIDEIFGFTGAYSDPLTGQQYNRARWYDPELHQWLSADPIGFAAGDSNTRRYVGNDPLNKVDPSGLQPPQSGPVLRAPNEKEMSINAVLQAKRQFIREFIDAYKQHLDKDVDPLEAYRLNPADTEWLFQRVYARVQRDNAELAVARFEAILNLFLAGAKGAQMLRDPAFSARPSSIPAYTPPQPRYAPARPGRTGADGPAPPPLVGPTPRRSSAAQDPLIPIAPRGTQDPIDKVGGNDR